MVVGLLIGLLLGAAGVWLVLRAQGAALRVELVHERARAELVASGEADLKARFDALAADALRKNNESFLELASVKLGQKEQAVEHLVAPLKESLQKVDGKLQELEVARKGAYSSLAEQVRQLMETQKELRSETGNLVSALRDRPNVRGRWGEMQLRRVVEMAGMLEHVDFETQAHVPTEDGRLRPDLVVQLPGGKKVVVDAKMAGQAYLESLSCEDDETRTSKLREHARQVRDHITKLSAKSYWAQFDQTPEFVILFIPGETFLSAALEQDPALIEDGVNQQVIIATPTTLIALLRAVSYGWRQETVAESARAVSDLGRELYSRLATMTEHFAKVGRGLETAVRSYNETVGSLETRVLPSARKFKEHGVSPAGELAPLSVVDRSIRPVNAVELQAPELPAADADAA
ncbi:MAG TPA: DNA recombination protein RmuC [Gaiellaceae bacterium]|jgi:DNA recombination protein RmuC|nr:DNA recombination protein RmuC [Gaiellaceae bacterium]